MSKWQAWYKYLNKPAECAVCTACLTWTWRFRTAHVDETSASAPCPHDVFCRRVDNFLFDRDARFVPDLVNKGKEGRLPSVSYQVTAWLKGKWKTKYFFALLHGVRFMSMVVVLTPTKSTDWVVTATRRSSFWVFSSKFIFDLKIRTAVIAMIHLCFFKIYRFFYKKFSSIHINISVSWQSMD